MPGENRDVSENALSLREEERDERGTASAVFVCECLLLKSVLSMNEMGGIPMKKKLTSNQI